MDAQRQRRSVYVSQNRKEDIGTDRHKRHVLIQPPDIFRRLAAAIFEGGGKYETTRREVIEIVRRVPLRAVRARTQPANMRVTAKQRGCDRMRRPNDLRVCSSTNHFACSGAYLRSERERRRRIRFDWRN